VHRHRYHGVLAPNARLRPHVVARGRPELVSKAPAAEGPTTSTPEAPASGRPGDPPSSASPPIRASRRPIPGPFRLTELPPLVRLIVAPASAPLRSSPPLSLLTPCPVLPHLPPRKAL
jgi:hypothetical protein